MNIWLNLNKIVKKIYAGGDLIGSKATVAWAAFSGRKASDAIAESFKK